MLKFNKNNKEILNRALLVQNDRDGESGRSMVEMLGVLAIIGVLSVAGIAGYTTAMRSYRTNEIVNAASMLYVMGMATNKGEGTGTLNYSDIATNPSGATLSYNADKTITINITDADDCAMVKNKLGDKATGDCPNITVTLGEMTTSIEEDLTVYNGEYDFSTETIICPSGLTPFYAVSGPACVKSLVAATQACIGWGCSGAKESSKGYRCTYCSW